MKSLDSYNDHQLAFIANHSYVICFDKQPPALHSSDESRGGLLTAIEYYLNHIDLAAKHPHKNKTYEQRLELVLTNYEKFEERLRLNGVSDVRALDMFKP